ncbi:SCO family protein [Marinicella meishanensis]|uniref:SCO family protein n=1 Tax=Marinicella meishanensis TaxID=2873263 RepID=UPI001CBEEBF8|nr:SCO family protein [Marinicella sp. NBU2979]
MLVLVLALGLTACGEQASQPDFKALKMFPQGKSFSGFTLTSHHGKAWDAEAFKGTYSVVFFGFANCPDICPTTLLDMQKIDHQLKQQNLPSPRFIFISVDPNRDTPENLKEYINFFNPEFYALTGDAANILSIATQLGVAYNVAEHEPGDLVYDVDHASALYVLNPAGERIGLFTAPHDVQLITQDLMALMESS